MDKENEFLKISKYFYKKLFIKREPRIQKFSEIKLWLEFYDPDKKSDCKVYFHNSINI